MGGFPDWVAGAQGFGTLVIALFSGMPVPQIRVSGPLIFVRGFFPAASTAAAAAGWGGGLRLWVSYTPAGCAINAAAAAVAIAVLWRYEAGLRAKWEAAEAAAVEHAKKAA